MPIQTTRRTLLLVVAGVAIAIIGYMQVRTLLDDPRILKPYDFVEYWSAGRLFLDGHNPYDPDRLQPLQRSIHDGVDKAIMMWNPPWALPLIVPFAAVPWRIGQLAWLMMQLGAVLLSADLLWRIYGGDPRRRWVAYALALTFAPTIFLLFIGQISGLLLLGLTGFLYFWKRQRFALAGVAAALTALKPHHLALFALLLVLQSGDRRVRRIIVAGAAVLLMASALPLLVNSHVWQQYREALRRPSSATFESMEDFEHETLGYWLRQRIPGQPFAVMFVPLALAAVGTVGYWRRHRRAWDWQSALPGVVVVSLLVTPYGAWAFDMVLLLLPLLSLAVRIERPMIGLAVWLAVNVVVVAMTPRWNAWIAPVVTVVWSVGVLRFARPPRRGFTE